MRATDYLEISVQGQGVKIETELFLKLEKECGGLLAKDPKTAAGVVGLILDKLISGVASGTIYKDDNGVAREVAA